MAENTTRSARPTMTRARGGIGRPTIDTARLAEAVSMPGIDPRMWFVGGTVGTRDEDGVFRTDVLVESPGDGPKVPEAVYVDDLGPVVDVRIEPEGDIVTARYNGIGIGRFGVIVLPIRSGDEVLLGIPGGDFNSPAITIVALGGNTTARIPIDWNNDRVLFDLNVPLEIRGPAVDIRSANLKLNGRRVAWSPEGV